MSRVRRGEDGFIREDPVESYRMPLLEHLKELRKRLIVSLAVLVLSCVLTFSFAQEIWSFLVAPMNEALQTTGRGTMAMTNPIEGFMTYMRVAGIAGIGLSSPVIFYQLWKFIAPGLYPKEQRLVLPLVVGSTTLFLTGAAFAYYIIFRFSFPLFLTVTTEDVQAVVSMNSYLSVASTLLLAFGVAFQLPVVIWLLSVIGLVNHRDLIRFFRFAMVGIAVVAAILTPPDVISMSLMSVPLTGLYIASIGISWAFSTKKLATEESPDEKPVEKAG